MEILKCVNPYPQQYPQRKIAPLIYFMFRGYLARSFFMSRGSGAPAPPKQAPCILQKALV